MPKEIQPPKVVAMVYYLATHPLDLEFFLRERKPCTMEQMFLYAQEIEDNIWACGNLPYQNIYANLGINQHKQE